MEREIHTGYACVSYTLVSYHHHRVYARGGEELGVQVWVRVYVCLRGRKKDALEMFSPGQRGVTLGIQSKLSPPSFSLPFPPFL